MNDSFDELRLQHSEHEAWVAAAQELRRIGFDINTVDVETFEPARVLLCRWAIAYAAGHEAGVFTTLKP